LVLCQLLGFAVIETEFAEWGICVGSLGCSHHSHEDNMKAVFAASLLSELLRVACVALQLFGAGTLAECHHSTKMNIPVRKG